MKIETRKVMKLSGIAIAATAVASATAYLTTRLLTREALDRDEPRVFQKAGNLISGTQSGNAFQEELRKAAEKLAQKENETVEITGHDGVPLVGHWIPCENAKRVIIAMHGWRSAWYKDFGMVSNFWERNGCSVLYAEQRGQGNSGGDFIGFGPIERYDCLDWIHWVSKRCGTELPIYLCGVSMGATTVLMAAGLDLPENVHGIMTAALLRPTPFGSMLPITICTFPSGFAAFWQIRCMNGKPSRTLHTSLPLTRCATAAFPSCWYMEPMTISFHWK